MPPAEVGELGLIEILSRATRLVQARLAEERLVVHPPDSLIRIPLPDLSLFEFDRSAEAITAGRDAARAALPTIRLAIDEAASIPGRVARWLNPPPNKRARR